MLIEQSVNSYGQQGCKWSREIPFGNNGCPWNSRDTQ